MFQFKSAKKENGPLLYRLHITNTPFFDSSSLNDTYSVTKGIIWKSKPNSFSFSTVIIRQRNHGASVAGLILKNEHYLNIFFCKWSKNPSNCLLCRDWRFNPEMESLSKTPLTTNFWCNLSILPPGQDFARQRGAIISAFN